MNYQFILFSLGLLLNPVVVAQTLSGADYLTPNFKPGDAYSNVFSISRSVTVDGFDELVRRNGGSADYVITEAGANFLKFHIAYRYDGQAVGAGDDEFRDGGRSSCHAGSCSANSDASGLLYNPSLWGTPPDKLSLGQTWVVPIDKPWELGAANGKQTVTVISLDAATATVTLMREGASRGLFADEKADLVMSKDGTPIKMHLAAGEARWHGYTVFSKGRVISDELEVQRINTLTLPDGKERQAVERRIMLLNASPVPSAKSQF